MNELDSCELSLTIKQLKLAVKFPCKLTFHHAGKSITSEIASSPTNVFSVNKDVSIRQQRPKEAIQININLATDKGGNIMAGIMRLNLKDINQSNGQMITTTLQKCLDPYATCTLLVKSVKLNKSRVKNINAPEDKRMRMLQQSKFQTKSEAPCFEIFRSRTRNNEADLYQSKKVSFNNVSSPTSFIKQKALSTAGFKSVKDISFDREELGSRFKHLNRKVEEDSKTVITGKWRQTDQVLKSTMEANQKALKMQILKYKTKYEESQRNLEEKQRQIKNLKDHISQLNRQVTEKQYLMQEISTKNGQISKLQEINKQISKEFHEDRNKIIDLQRQMDEQNTQFLNQIARMKEDYQKRQYDLQKQIYQRKQEIKQITEDSQYKVNQIKKMKVLIEDLEKGMEVKTLQFEKIYMQQKNEHSKTRTSLQAKIAELSSRIESSDAQNVELKENIKNSEDQLLKLSNKIRQIQDALKQTEENLEAEIQKKDKLAEEKKILLKNQQDLTNKIKQVQKEFAIKQKEASQIINQLNESSNSNKKKITQLIDRNKAQTTKIQQLQSKCNVLTASEQKLKRTLQISQKQNKNLQQNEKILSKNLKLKDDRILQLQRQITDLENKILMKQNLGKKDIEYKVSQLEKLTAKMGELQKHYQRQREENEARRLDLLKNQNRIRMLEEANHRLTDQIAEIKSNNSKKQEQLRLTITELHDQIKTLQGKQTQLNKNLHNAEMQRINLRNEVTKAQKSIQNLIQKQERSKKREHELQNTIKSLTSELQSRNEQIIDLQADFKNLENDFRLLQADKFKHQKITTIISEEKDNIKNDVSKLKKQLQKRDAKQEQYLSQIKTLKQQLTKTELRLSTVSKQFQKFKNNISQAVKSVMILKQNHYTMDTISQQSNIQLSRSINRSRVIKNQNSDVVISFEDAKLGQVIENFSRDSHQTIGMLNEQVRRLRKEKDYLEKENQTLNNRLKDTQEELAKTVRDLNNQIETIVSRANEDAEEYEQKISYLQTQLGRKEKSLSELTNSVQEMASIHENQKSSHQMNVSELLNKIQSLRFKIADLERKDENNALVFVSLQEKMAQLQQYNSEIINHNEILSDQVQKKQRTIALKTQENQDLLDELQTVKKQKTEQSIEILSLKQSLTIEKENNQRLLSEIKYEQHKNSQLKLSQNQILKQKQQFLKKDFEKSQKLYSVQEKIQYTMIELAQRNEQLAQKVKIINEQKETLKTLQVQINNTQLLLNEAKLNLQKERQRLKEKQRKISEKDAETENLNGQIKKNNLRYDTQVKKSTQEYDALNETFNKAKLQYSVKSQEYQLQIKTLKESQRRTNEANMSLEEQIYFQRQNNALNISKIEQLKQQISQLQHENSKLTNQIHLLTDQLKEKEESLFAISGKLYASDNRLESKEEEFKSRIEKVDLDWRYKLEQICEEYEHKLEIIQREKNYVRNGMNDFNQNVQKLQNEKIALKIQHEREKQAWQNKVKRFEEEKLAALIEKNKQIEKLREVIEELQEKIKRKDFEVKLLDEEKKKLQEKFKELKIDMQRLEQKKNESVRTFEKQIDQLKRKQGQLKRFKDALKNNQWTIQRQIKKSIQNASKNMANLTNETSKGEVLQIMRSLQSSIVKLALPNIDEL